MRCKIISTLIFSVWSIQTVYCGEIPQLKFEKVIGNMQGKGINNISVAVADNSVIYLLMAGGRAAVFDRDGKYQKSLKVDSSVWWPNSPYLATAGNRVLVGLYQKDYPWVYAPERKGDSEGKFSEPAMVAVDQPGNIYVADAGNTRIQIFSPDNIQAPKEIIKPPAAPYRLAVRNNRLAVYCADQNLMLYEKTEKGFARKEILKIGPGANSLSLGPDGSVFVAFGCGPNRHWLKKYGIRDEAFKEIATIAPSYMDQWPNFFPAGTSLTKGPDNEIWFGSDTFAKVLSLDPKTDGVKERITGDKRYISIGFGTKGEIYLGTCNWGAPNDPNIYIYSEGIKKLEKFMSSGGGIYEDKTPIWGILPDKDGGIYVRIVEEGYQKGWPALTFKKVFPDGTMKMFADFGELYGKWRRGFTGPGPIYALQFDQEKNIILSAQPLVGVLKLSPDGKTIWEASARPKGGADKIEFSGPTDIALDRKGNIWVTDGEQNKVFCLSPAGKSLFEYGGYANVDDTEGKGFDCPTGIETALVNGEEFLYIGDAGNQRIVKYKIMYP